MPVTYVKHLFTSCTSHSVEGHYEPTEKDDEMVISNVALYAAETWMLIQTDIVKLL